MGTAAKAMTGVAVFAAGVAVAMALRPDAQVSKDADTGQPAATPAAWSVPDIDALPDDPWGRTVRHGRDLIAQTAAVIGPEVANPARRLSGNNLNCQSCHLQAGTQQFGLPLVGVFADFPQYRGRSGRVNTIEDRVNGCMTRSMNGKALPEGGEDMVAIVAYLKFLSSGRPVGAPTEGRGSVRLADLARAADPARGKAVYAQHCAVCHGSDGAGQRAGKPGDAKGYTYPPLWGADSYNNGAGMGRVTTAAGFIRSNMPLGTGLAGAGAIRGAGVRRRRLYQQPAAPAARRARAGLSPARGKAGGRALWPLCRRFLQRAAPLRPVWPDAQPRQEQLQALIFGRQSTRSTDFLVR